MTNTYTNTEEIKKKKRGRRNLIIVIYLIAIALLITFIYLVPNVTGKLTQTMTLEYGSIQVSDDITCYVVRDEVVYYANKDGAITPHIEEGTLVRMGTEILSLTGAEGENSQVNFSTFNSRVLKYLNDDNLYIADHDKILDKKNQLNTALKKTSNEVTKQCITSYIDDLVKLLDDPESVESGNEEQPVYNAGIMPESYATGRHGIISYYLDGYERELNPYTMTLLDKKKVSSLSFDIVNAARETTSVGDPLFKVINNSKWYAITWIEAKDLRKYEVGNSIKLKLPNGDVKGSVSEILDNSGDVMVVLKFDRYYEGLTQLRKLDTEVITADNTGLLVNNEFLTTVEGQPGVYVKTVTGEFSFTPVKVKAGNGTYSLLESGFYYETVNGDTNKVSTVNVYDEIKKPSLITG